MSPQLRYLHLLLLMTCTTCQPARKPHTTQACHQCRAPCLSTSAQKQSVQTMADATRLKRLRPLPVASPLNQTHPGRHVREHCCHELQCTQLDERPLV